MSTRHVAVIGSSGGGAATLTSGTTIVDSLRHHIESIRAKKDENEDNKTDLVRITEVILVQCDVGMDFAREKAHEVKATWWMLHEGRWPLDCKGQGNLIDINNALAQHDERLAQCIDTGAIDALITISCDPEGANKKTIESAIRAGIPIVGTGGTSMSTISTLGGNVIGCSGGSVATTGTSRGICFAASLAAFWGADLVYVSPIPSKSAKFHSVIGAALPLILAASVFRSLATIVSAIYHYISNCRKWEGETMTLFTTFATSLEIALPKEVQATIHKYALSGFRDWILGLELRVLPVVISAITCMEVARLQELSMLSGAAACALLFVDHVSAGNSYPLSISSATCEPREALSTSSHSGVLGVSLVCSYIAGTIAGHLLPRLLIYCARKSLLPTATTVVAVGVAATVSGALASALAAPVTLILSASQSLMKDAVRLFALLVTLSFGFFLSRSDPSPPVAAFPSVDDFYRNSTAAFGLFADAQLRLCSHGASGSSLDILGNCWVGYAVLGALLGWAASWGSEHGYYHSVMLPLIAIQMERGKMSAAGSFDLACLCMPCAGVCAAAYLRSCMKSLRRANCENDGERLKDRACSSGAIDVNRRLGWRGMVSNLTMGDFVEACYPYTLSRPWLLLSVRVACAVAGAVLMSGGEILQRFRFRALPNSGGCVVSGGADTIWCDASGFPDPAVSSVGHVPPSVPLSSAYLPLPLSLILAAATGLIPTEVGALSSSFIAVAVLAIACAVAFVVPFVAAFILLLSIA